MLCLSHITQLQSTKRLIMAKQLLRTSCVKRIACPTSMTFSPNHLMARSIKAQISNCLLLVDIYENVFTLFGLSTKWDHCKSQANIRKKSIIPWAEAINWLQKNEDSYIKLLRKLYARH